MSEHKHEWEISINDGQFVCSCGAHVSVEAMLNLLTVTRIEVSQQAARIAELEAKLAQAQARLETVVHCPHCSDQGWYQVLDKWTGEPKQEQCEFCHTVYNSAYNAALRALDEEGDDVEA